MRVVLYTGEQERDSAILFAESQGETMIHDDFNIGPQGENQLTFDIVPEPPADPSEAVKETLREKLGSRQITFPELIDLIALERGL